MYNVLDVSRFVINYSNEKNYGISNLKLQKVLYFIQAYFLVYTEKGSPCFCESIEAWDFGPVVPEVYHEYKQYGSGDIPKVKSDIFMDDDINVITDEDKKIIQSIVDRLSNYTATELVEITHKQKPWSDVYEPFMNNIITNESIKEYFNE